MLLIRPSATGATIDDASTYAWQVPSDVLADPLACQMTDALHALLSRCNMHLHLPDEAQQGAWQETFPNATHTQAQPAQISEYALCCIDKRLMHLGVPTGTQTDESLSHIAHPGGALLFDVYDASDMHTSMCEKIIQSMKQTASKIVQCDHHIGIAGGSGCALYTSLPDKIKNRYQTLDDIINMLKCVRTRFMTEGIATNQCRITITAIDKNNNRQVLNLDSAHTPSILASLPDVVL